jgi:hypothetical protein
MEIGSEQVHIPQSVEQAREEQNQESEYAEPHVDKRSLVPVRRRCGDAEDERQSTEDVGKKLDHCVTLSAGCRWLIGAGMVHGNLAGRGEPFRVARVDMDKNCYVAWHYTTMRRRK